ncbi:hypothetical protein AB0F52_48430 [Amycolatopsis sp. NPDC024027]|uniref:hypothetical protein n=1 Tax=Amycolatopsis sp. NPDC024027 TaxID=3154327 RepID=UPI0033F84A67
MLLRADLVEGHTDAGALASGQVVGLIDSLPTVEKLVTSVVEQAEKTLRRTSEAFSC